MNIGIMGATGSFSEQAAKEYVTKKGIDGAEIKPLISAARVLEGVESGDVDLGIFPIENSNGGIVIEAVHAMAKHRFVIAEMFDIDIHHALLVAKGTITSHIQTITSHDQALKQCRMYLKRVWSGADIQEYEDTAKAAEDLGTGMLPNTTAVIAPRRCAELYGLDILEEKIQDLKFNFTTFVLAKKA